MQMIAAQRQIKQLICYIANEFGWYLPYPRKVVVVPK